MRSQALEPQSRLIIWPSELRHFYSHGEGLTSIWPHCLKTHPRDTYGSSPYFQPQISPDFPAGTALSWPPLRKFWYIPGRRWCSVCFVLPL